MNYQIRLETPADHRAVETIARDAFWNLYFPGCHEHFVVHQMRNHPDFIKELSFVIQVDKDVAGAIFYTHSAIVHPDGTETKPVTFGPVCIAPQYHRMGLGRALITHSIQVAKEMGFRGILTLGYPHHYTPYGFLGGKAYGISMEDGQYYTGLLALPLYEVAFESVAGFARFSPVFEVTQEDVDGFDAEFPAKDKLVLPCQQEYERACSEVDV